MNLTTTSDIQSITESFQSVITAIAMIAAGLWAYTLEDFEYRWISNL